MNRRDAFTLVELLVVISIIALLLSVLMPTLSRARKLARASVCANNLRQIAIGTTLYAQAYNNSFMPTGGQPHWFILITPYLSGAINKNADGAQISKEKYQLCPEAIVAQPQYYVDNPEETKAYYGGAKYAWGWLGEVSYGVNSWLLPYGNDKTSEGRSKWEIGARQSSVWPYFWQSGRMSDVPSDVIMYADSRWVLASPTNGDAPPPDLYKPIVYNGGLDVFCMDRHSMAINVVSVGTVVKRMSLSHLWKLHYTKKAVPYREVSF